MVDMIETSNIIIELCCTSCRGKLSVLQDTDPFQHTGQIETSYPIQSALVLFFLSTTNILRLW